MQKCQEVFATLDYLQTEAFLKPTQTSNMELFPKIVIGWKPLTISAKNCSTRFLIRPCLMMYFESCQSFSRHPANIYLFKVDVDVFLVFLLLTLNIFHTFFYSVSIVDFEQVNVSWLYIMFWLFLAAGKNHWHSTQCLWEWEGAVKMKKRVENCGWCWRKDKLK